MGPTREPALISIYSRSAVGTALLGFAVLGGAAPAGPACGAREACELTLESWHLG